MKCAESNVASKKRQQPTRKYLEREPTAKVNVMRNATSEPKISRLTHTASNTPTELHGHIS